MPGYFIGIRATVLTWAACFALAACNFPPEARTALSDGPTADYDQRIIGNWVQLGNKSPIYLRISKTKQKQTLQGVVTMLFQNAVGWGHTTVYPTRIGGTVYYNVRRTKGIGQDYTAPGEKPGFMIMRPVFMGRDVMVVCALHAETPTNSDAAKLFAKYGIKTRKVTGGTKTDKTKYLILDVSRRELRRLVVAAPAQKLFGGFLSFVRVGGSAGTMRTMRKRMKNRRNARKKGCPFELAR